MFDMDGQVAVVTGGGRGIGEGIARCFAEQGAAVVVAARRANEVEAVAASIRDAGGRAIGVPTDVTDDDQLVALADAAIEAFGPLTVWVNNAGGSSVMTPLTELGRDAWDAAVLLNLTAAWRGSVIAAARMERGCIINISSRAAFGPAPTAGHYAACKAGLNSLTQTMAAELAPAIRVNGIAPGSVPTEIAMKARGFTTQEDLERHAQRTPRSDSPRTRRSTTSRTRCAPTARRSSSGRSTPTPSSV